ncbi:hypothetical protein FT663_00725 [Candidozyma haemuli var. vulneris]|uniref:Ribosomal lysine N-methyltransferase 5 n=1 Tax=Candidozyma haemuli TaxID=45357 RepID=A0A2V1AQ08_9ASCO|nr:hypothetical protein CXQ85_003680 [[Candida] haemuloni]KAF3992445.1 hypothetical protein FT662_01154 [[Candida] haemuloni var. vulneris]KAF3995182.1 hypothetical protein FT663_00725 [[Candida] haemuloni var. vulneris]PVH19822.1 hypothetical protein CXQ85_003680 [[Candida] haemuloni]
MDISNSLIKVNLDDIDDHVYDIHITHRPPDAQNLGYVDKSTDTLHLSLPTSGDELTITQSRSSLSGQESSSTGFVCWQSVKYLADWILGDPKCPFYSYFKGDPQLAVLELGAGVGAVLASLLGPRSRVYVATDQKHILKLMKQNFLQNVSSSRWSSKTLEWSQTAAKAQIEVVEYDWENHGDVEKVLELMNSTPDLIIATDTIYNEYLVPYFVGALAASMGTTTGALVTVQLRDESITARFVEELAAQKLQLYTIKEELLSPELISGFAVYYITK